VGSIGDAWVTSGSSLFTLGFARPDGTGLIWLTFVEATIGLGIVALLISYLPTLYTAYSAREQGVGMLSPITGSPPSSRQLLRRLDAANALAGTGIWGQTAGWFVAIHQSHTAFPALSRFPPQDETRSWVATAGTVLDGAALMIAAVGHPLVDGVDGVDERDRRNELGSLVLTLAHGSSALVEIAAAAGLPVDDDPPTLLELVGGLSKSPEPISIDRKEYDETVAWLVHAGVIAPVDDPDRAWEHFRQIRSSYDTALRGLAGLTHAPPAPWSTDRALLVGRPRFFSHRPVAMQEP
jgi:hypothetical protein